MVCSILPSQTALSRHFRQAIIIFITKGCPSGAWQCLPRQTGEIWRWSRGKGVAKSEGCCQTGRPLDRSTGGGGRGGVDILLDLDLALWTLDLVTLLDLDLALWTLDLVILWVIDGGFLVLVLFDGWRWRTLSLQSFFRSLMEDTWSQDSGLGNWWKTLWW